MRQSCYANQTCNVGLVCLSNVCVSEGTGGAGGASASGGAGGKTGTAGTTGQGGTTGGAGTTGAAGAAGTTGGAGTTGAAGTTGGAGTTGSAGTSGAAGTTGGAGTTGAAGTTGGAGTTGAAGTTGGAGTTGAAGTSGAAGTTGAAGTSGAAGSGGSGCLAAASYSSFLSVAGQTLTQIPLSGGGTYYEENIAGRLTTATAPDAIYVYIASKSAHFPGDITTGTFTLTSDDAQAATCSICVFLYADLNLAANPATPAATYIATSGTVILTSLADKTSGTGTIAGSLSNVTFQQVTIDPTSQASTPDGSCSSSVSSLSFSAASTLSTYTN